MEQPRERFVEHRRHCLAAPQRWAILLYPIPLAGVVIALAFRNVLTLVGTVPLFALSVWFACRVTWCIEIVGHGLRWNGLLGEGHAGLAQVTELRARRGATGW